MLCHLERELTAFPHWKQHALEGWWQLVAPTYIRTERKGPKTKTLLHRDMLSWLWSPHLAKKDGPCVGNRVLSHQTTFSQEELGTFPVRGCPAWEAFSRLTDFVWSEVGVLWPPAVLGFLALTEQGKPARFCSQRRDQRAHVGIKEQTVTWFWYLKILPFP